MTKGGGYDGGGGISHPAGFRDAGMRGIEAGGAALFPVNFFEPAVDVVQEAHGVFVTAFVGMVYFRFFSVCAFDLVPGGGGRQSEDSVAHVRLFGGHVFPSDSVASELTNTLYDSGPQAGEAQHGDDEHQDEKLIDSCKSEHRISSMHRSIGLIAVRDPGT